MSFNVPCSHIVSIFWNTFFQFFLLFFKLFAVEISISFSPPSLTHSLSSFHLFQVFVTCHSKAYMLHIVLSAHTWVSIKFMSIKLNILCHFHKFSISSFSATVLTFSVAWFYLFFSFVFLFPIFFFFSFLSRWCSCTCIFVFLIERRTLPLSRLEFWNHSFVSWQIYPRYGKKI